MTQLLTAKRKSELAIEFALQHRERFPWAQVFWVHANTRSGFEEDCRKITQALGHAKQDDCETDVRLLLHWLTSKVNGQWLLILDGADDFAFLQRPQDAYLIPRTRNGSVLITSRDRKTAVRLVRGRYNSIIEVPIMDLAQAQALLKNQLNQGDGEEDEDKVRELLTALDFIPLTIMQAAAYINHLGPRGSVSKYLELLKDDKSRPGLLRNRPDSESTIAAVWNTSIHRVQSERATAARLLYLMSFFYDKGIPGIVLSDYNTRPLMQKLQKRLWSLFRGFPASHKIEEQCTMEFDDDLATLRSYSLITLDVSGENFGTHKSVQTHTRDCLRSQGEEERWRKKFLRVMSIRFPDHSSEICDILLPHVAEAAREEPQDPESARYWSQILTNASRHLLESGRYKKATEMIQKAVAVRERILGATHSDTLMSISIFALILERQNCFDKAEELHQYVLKKRERILGAAHPDTLMSMSILASVLQSQEKHQEAEAMYQQALKGRERVLGKEHHDTITSMNDLARILHDRGKFQAAAKLYQQCVERRERLWGKEHPITLARMDDLARMYEIQGRFEAAVTTYQQALGRKQGVLRHENADVFTSIGNLASALQSQGSTEEAITMKSTSGGRHGEGVG